MSDHAPGQVTVRHTAARSVIDRSVPNRSVANHGPYFRRSPCSDIGHGNIARGTAVFPLQELPGGLWTSGD